MKSIRLMVVRDRRCKQEVLINSPKAVFDLLAKEARYQDRERFLRIDLDARHRVLGWEVVSVGTLSASLVHPREFFKAALLSNAAGVIAAHNHPSQDVTPSQEDKDSTRRLKSAGELLGVPLLDHVILSDKKFYSFRDAGIL